MKMNVVIRSQKWRTLYSGHVVATCFKSYMGGPALSVKNRQSLEVP